MTTEDAIKAAYMRLYATQRPDAITVKSLCAAVPVARTTFYAHFRNTDDVLVNVEDDLLAGIADVTRRISGGNLPAMDYPAFLDALFAYILDNLAWFRALLIVHPDARFITRWKAAIKHNFALRYPDARLHPEWDLLAEMAASAAIGAYTHELSDPDRLNLSRIEILVDRALAGVMTAL